jgi:hypothetical protein
MTDKPVDLDRHRGIAAQKATDLRRTLADADSAAQRLREHQGVIEAEILDVPAASWSVAASKARYVLNLYAASLGTEDSRHRDLVASILDDFDRLDAQYSSPSR